MTATSRPKAYLLIGCPFSMRLRLFLSEARLEDEVEIVPVEGGSERYRQLFADIAQTGVKPSFPVVQHADGSFELDSEAIIDRMAHEHGIDLSKLTLLQFYNDGMLPRFGKMMMELKRLKGPQWDGAL